MNELDKTTIDASLPFYALDTMSDEERAAVDSYLLEHPEAKAELDALQAAASHLPALAAPIAPDPATRRALMARVEAEGAPSRVPSPPAATPVNKKPPAPARSPRRGFRDWFWPALSIGATVAAVLALVWGAGLLAQTRSLDSRVALLQEATSSMQGELSALEGALADAERAANEAEARLDDVEIQNAALREQLRQQQDVLAAYTAPGAITMAIGDATGENPTATGTLTVAADQPARFFTANLLPLPAEQTYQLWLIDGETPISAGTFLVDETGAGALEIADLPGSFNAVGVSIEPAGGSELPTFDQIVLLGMAGG